MNFTLLIVYIIGIFPTYVIHRHVFTHFDKEWTTMDRALSISASVCLSWFSVLLDALIILLYTYKDKPAKW